MLHLCGAMRMQQQRYVYMRPTTCTHLVQVVHWLAAHNPAHDAWAPRGGHGVAGRKPAVDEKPPWHAQGDCIQHAIDMCPRLCHSCLRLTQGMFCGRLFVSITFPIGPADWCCVDAPLRELPAPATPETLATTAVPWGLHQVPTLKSPGVAVGARSSRCHGSCVALALRSCSMAATPVRGPSSGSRALPRRTSLRRSRCRRHCSLRCVSHSVYPSRLSYKRIHSVLDACTAANTQIHSPFGELKPPLKPTCLVAVRLIGCPLVPDSPDRSPLAVPHHPDAPAWPIRPQCRLHPHTGAACCPGAASKIRRAWSAARCLSAPAPAFGC